MRRECEESEKEYKTFGRTNLMISTCSSKPETTGLNIQWENLKPCMPQPHWLLHNHCWGPPHWRFLLSQGGRAFPSTLTELLLLPDDGFSKPQSPFFSLTQKRVVNPKSLISKDPFFFFFTLKKENKKKKKKRRRGEILRKTPPQQTEWSPTYSFTKHTKLEPPLKT
jgi:hypothetical protein